MSDLQFHQQMRAEGRCPRCRREHNDVNPHTGRKFWRCAFCRAEQASAQRGGYTPTGLRKQGQRVLVTCACGKPMIPSASACFHCRYKANGWKGKPRTKKAVSPRVPRHISTRLEVQFSPIVAHYAWEQAVWR